MTTPIAPLCASELEVEAREKSCFRIISTVVRTAVHLRTSSASRPLELVVFKEIHAVLSSFEKAAVPT
jgi:hypothetical protein